MTAGTPPAVYYNVNTPPPDEQAPPLPDSTDGEAYPIPAARKRKKDKEGSVDFQASEQQKRFIFVTRVIR